MQSKRLWLSRSAGRPQRQQVCLPKHSAILRTVSLSSCMAHPPAWLCKPGTAPATRRRICFRARDFLRLAGANSWVLMGIPLPLSYSCKVWLS